MIYTPWKEGKRLKKKGIRMGKEWEIGSSLQLSGKV